MSKTVGAALDELKQNLKIDIKSLLCSSPDGLTEKELRSDYRNYTNKEIPYSTLGYHGLYEMIKDMPDVATVRRHRNGATWIFDAVVDESTKQLRRLVGTQKDMNKGKRDQKRSREVNYHYSSMRNFAYSAAPRETISHFIQSNIEQVLRLAPNFILHRVDFDRQYQFKFGIPIVPKKFGYNTLRELMDSVKHLVYIQPKSANFDDYFIGLVVKQVDQLDPAKKQLSSNGSSLDLVREPLATSSLDQGLNRLGSSARNGLLTYEEDMIENLKRFFDVYGEEGITVGSLKRKYKVSVD
jgi:hypothetical protein